MIESGLIQRLRAGLWDAEQAARHPLALIRIARYLFVLGRDVADGQLTMRAVSLVYTTLLSLVPMLALGFSVLKALGVRDSLEPVLRELMRPLGPQGHEITQSIIGFVEKIQVGVVGSLGVALLFYTAISMIRKVEESFNFIWRIERPRPLSQRFGEYMGVLIMGPVLVFSAIALTASVFSSGLMVRIATIEPFGFLIYLVTLLAPYVLIVGAFTFLYSFVPNTRVQLRAAATGGILAGLLWQTGSALFASFVSAATNFNAIYSSFAILIFLLIWLYVGWLILLVGCHVAYHVQHPEHLKPSRIPPTLSGKQTEYLSLMVMALSGRRFIDGAPGYTPEELSLALNAAPEHVSRVIEALIFHGLLTESGQDRTRLMPAMDLDSIELARLWRLSRAGAETLPPANDELGRRVYRLLDEAETALENRTGPVTLRQWLVEEPAKP